MHNVFFLTLIAISQLRQSFSSRYEKSDSQFIISHTDARPKVSEWKM